MPRMGSNARRSALETQPGLSVRRKKKFCMYHLQGMCKFADGGCSFAHSAEEMQGVHMSKTRQRQRPHSGAASDGVSGKFQNGRKSATTAAHGVDGFGRRTPTQGQPTDLSEEHPATTAQAVLFEHRQVPPELLFPLANGTSSKSGRSKVSLASPPGLPQVRFQELVEHAPPPPPPPPAKRPVPYFAGVKGHTPPLLIAQGYPIQKPYLPESALNTVGLLQEKCAGTATMAEHTYVGDKRVVEVGTSVVELNALANSVHNALVMTSLDWDKNVIDALLLGPPGLSPSN